jgi:hypothetical protein
MNERERLLEKLVVDQHVNVAERRSLGIVTKEEVSEVLKTLVTRDGAFPLLHEAKAVYEGATITSDPSGWRITWERAYPWDPFTTAERRVQAFISIDAAVEALIDSEWSAGIDGIVITGHVPRSRGNG